MSVGFSRSLARLILTLALASAASAAIAAQPLKSESGRIEDFIARLASTDYLLGEPNEDPRPYIEPGPALHAIRHIAQQIAAGDFAVAARQADKVDCEVVEFTDLVTDDVYYALRENVSRLRQTRGWGSYIYKPSGRIDALVEVPHPIADVNTRSIGAKVFAASDAKGFLLAGTHRAKADVPDLVDSAFHQVHVAWVGPFAQVAAWQIHGFSLAKHEFPRGASVIVSTGDGTVVPELTHLDAMLENQGVTSYVFNDLSPESRANKRLNGGFPGVTFTSLAATENEQGRHSRRLGGKFVHVELESSLRLERTNRELVSSVIADAVRRTSESDAADDDDTAILASYTTPPEAAPESPAEAPVTRVAMHQTADAPQELPRSYTPAAQTQPVDEAGGQ